VPKFFRWLTERYPLTQEKLSDVSTVEIDNLYLDMNGIIHNCTHANEARVDASEDEMVRKCFLYIERLVRIARPQKVLFMAIDGALFNNSVRLPTFVVPSQCSQIDPVTANTARLLCRGRAARKDEPAALSKIHDSKIP
jgi:hypothetical protein